MGGAITALPQHTPFSYLLDRMSTPAPPTSPAFSTSVSGSAWRQSATPYENATAESFFKTLEREEVYGNHYQTFPEAETNLGQFIADVYHAKRMHSSLGYRPSLEVEAVHAATAGS